MNDNAYQETLFAEPIGLQLKHAREKVGMKQSDASSRLKLPVIVIDALEREDWQKLGAPIYIRSYLSSYLKLLGLPTSMANEVSFETAPTPAIKMLSTKPVRRDIDKSLTTLGHFAITGVIVASIAMIAMHFQSPSPRNVTLPLDVQTETNEPLVPSKKLPASGPTNVTAVSQTATTQAPIMASMAPVAAATAAGWEVRVNADSWLEVVDTDGKRIESGIVNAGSVRQYGAERIASMTIGNADQVQLLRNGQVVDFSAFKQDNVARFNVANDGALNSKTATN